MVEGDNKAILYTGDIRSEPWFVNAISRNPNLIEYTSGIKTLDKIYLDTSFTENVPFQTKAQGIAELLRKVSQYPSDTIFHLQAWTYGYEDVWLALSKALKSKVSQNDLTGRRTLITDINRFMSTITNSGSMAHSNQTPLTRDLTQTLILLQSRRL